MLDCWLLFWFFIRVFSGPFSDPILVPFQAVLNSRTIVGIEVLASGNNLRLLLFDPSHSRGNMSTLLKAAPNSSEAGQVMRMLRKSPAAIKCKQYQIVAVTGVLANDKEAEKHKVIRSQRMPWKYFPSLNCVWWIPYLSLPWTKCRHLLAKTTRKYTIKRISQVLLDLV